MKWPVGLLNVGNTCWFNVVIQSFYNLPYFRALIVKFTPEIFSSIDNEVGNDIFHLYLFT